MHAEHTSTPSTHRAEPAVRSKPCYRQLTYVNGPAAERQPMDHRLAAVSGVSWSMSACGRSMQVGQLGNDEDHVSAGQASEQDSGNACGEPLSGQWTEGTTCAASFGAPKKYSTVAPTAPLCRAVDGRRGAAMCPWEAQVGSGYQQACLLRMCASFLGSGRTFLHQRESVPHGLHS